MEQQNISRPDWAWLCRDKRALLAFGFGAGLARKAPGTWGSLVGLLFAGLLLGCGVSHTGLFLLSVVLFWAGIGLCTHAGDALGKTDHSGIVWDEIVAMMMVYALIPQGFFWWLAGFGAFRLFDVLKPAPVAWAERRFRGGLGVMADDAVAALCAVLLLQLANCFI
ncbi:phosphatidylglycerophosphatase A family protein [Conchiformibius kuhniae]|uniref:Phosphatidylglycerophosphatase A n=1 Tax=Conchiformibius kuhniae TaxID=211502 RepID=A0A8T9MWE0_9NEIS|nr:phosphatidylglycerophosphatase A [Conchiformibius kuhniae]UOP04776.1 phosphatidylglycerophosphatase A [Conchiformibius kuhniae]